MKTYVISAPEKFGKRVHIIHFGKVAVLGKIEWKIDFTNFFREINLMKTTSKVKLI